MVAESAESFFSTFPLSNSPEIQALNTEGPPWLRSSASG